MTPIWNDLSGVVYPSGVVYLSGSFSYSVLSSDSITVITNIIKHNQTYRWIIRKKPYTNSIKKGGDSL